ncbi:MAG: hypothetical protein QM758_09020 [Armatimonas sp.]
MPEKDSLDTLLQKGDPAGTLPDTRSGSADRYNRLLPRLVEDSQRTAPAKNPRRVWFAVPALGLAALATMLLWRMQSPVVPQPAASPSVEHVVLNPSPTPLPISTVKPTPEPERKVADRKSEKPQLRTPQRRYRKRVRVASVSHSRRRHIRRVQQQARPVEHAHVERIVIEGSVEPTSRVAIVITGNGENLSVTHALQEEKS